MYVCMHKCTAKLLYMSVYMYVCVSIFTSLLNVIKTQKRITLNLCEKNKKITFNPKLHLKI